MIERFFNLLAEATARILPHYFQLPVAGREDPVFRERVYSYELYHQLRTLLALDRELAGYELSGEIDKQGHPIIRPCAPDFVLHLPGGMGANLVVIEVKPINAAQAGIEKDRHNLEYFVADEIGYQCGVQLVYGGDEGALERFIRIYRDANERVELFWHPAPGRPAARVRTQ
jgi:hypothetical protein